MAKLYFPKDFIWGVASSAYQIEGAWEKDGKGLSIWDTFTHKTGHILNNETGDVSIDHYHRYRDDIALMAKLGIANYRFSTAWTRILPDGIGKVNPNGIGFYDRLIDTLLKHKIEPYLCLFHYDLPQKIQDAGGWPNRDTAFHFAEYARVVAKYLGDRLNIIMTHNEPWVTAFVGYYFGTHAPGVQDLGAALHSLHHVLLSHGLAAEAIRAESKNRIKVGLTLNLSPVYSASNFPRDLKSVNTADTLLNKIVLDPLIKGTSPLQEDKLGKTLVGNIIKSGDLHRINTVDLLGVNYYSRSVVKHSYNVPLVQFTQVNPEGNDYSGMWEIYPEGLYDLLKRIHTDYTPGCEMMVTENGVPVPDGIDFDGRIRDVRRKKYLQEHLAQVHRAIQDGIPVKGYFHWSFMDNFEWALGYSQRFGLVYVEYQTQKRIVKDSGVWFSNVIRTNGFDF